MITLKALRKEHLIWDNKRRIAAGRCLPSIKFIAEGDLSKFCNFLVISFVLFGMFVLWGSYLISYLESCSQRIAVLKQEIGCLSCLFWLLFLGFICLERDSFKDSPWEPWEEFYLCCLSCLPSIIVGFGI